MEEGVESLMSKQIWEKRAELLRKSRDKKLTFSEFCLLDMHEETKCLLNVGKDGGLSEKGISTLCAIEMYLKELKPNNG